SVSENRCPCGCRTWLPPGTLMSSTLTALATTPQHPFSFFLPLKNVTVALPQPCCCPSFPGTQHLCSPAYMHFSCHHYQEDDEGPKNHRDLRAGRG
uniref:Uncharacterized protein n=1 Tax=Strigops habroptila TaxID=2489341 RepID=A0A672U8I5_STRHB